MAAVHLVLEEGSHLRGQKLGERELAGEEAAWEGEFGNTLSERAITGGLEDEGVL